MKLLLTSNGLMNQSIRDAFFELLSKPVNEVKVVLIPTAQNVEVQDKRWYVDECLLGFYDAGVTYIDIVDPSANDVEWRSRCEDADVILVGGGNTFHLLNQFRKTGFQEWLLKNRENKVYVGISAGSIVATPNIRVSAIPPADENTGNITDLTGLSLVDFEFEPHCDNERFTMLEEWVKDKTIKLYALDDDSAVKYVDGNVEVVSEGTWKLIESAGKK